MKKVSSRFHHGGHFVLILAKHFQSKSSAPHPSWWGTVKTANKLIFISFADVLIGSQRVQAQGNNTHIYQGLKMKGW